MQKKFPKLHWYQGRVRTKNGWETHSWMVDNNGTIYDPTTSQFDEIPSYEYDGDNCFVAKIDGKRAKRP